MTRKIGPSSSSSSKDSPTLKAALSYARQGLRVFPTYWPEPKQPGGCSCGKHDCKSPGKHPLPEHGFKDATTDEKQIRRWWKAWPKANVAAVPSDHEFVLDVDPRNGGEESFQALEREHGPFKTRKIRSGSGGLHLWFSTEEPIWGRNAVRPGIDIKGPNGYVLMPPSSHVEGKYELITDWEPAPAPRGLVDLIGRRPDRGASAALMPEQLRAPGETEEERLRWVRSAVDAIPNDAEFDDRDPWAGMAHHIRAACGDGLGSEAFEIFDQFCQRWTSWDCDPGETQRVWDSLKSTTSSRGYRRLVDLARRNGYQLPPDHPWRTDDPIAVLTADLEHAPLTDLTRLLRAFRTNSSALPGLERRIAEEAAAAALGKKLGTYLAGRRILEAASASTDGPFVVANGKQLIRVAEPQELELHAPFLVENLIPASAVGEVIADYSCGKTWLLLDLSLSIAFGSPFLSLPVQRAPALYLAYEGQRGLWRRIAGWLHREGRLIDGFTTHDLQELLKGRLLVAETPPLFDHPSVEQGLLDTVREFGVGLVVVDTRNKSLGVDQSEDSNDTAGQVNGMLSRIAAATGCTFVTAHHTGYTDKKRGRGASAWTQGVDFSLVVEGTKETFAAGGIMRLTPHKMRDDEWPGAVAYRLVKAPEFRVNGKICNSAYLESADEPAAVRDFASLSTRVLLFVEENPGCSAEKIRKGVEGKNDKIDAMRKALLGHDAIENRGRANRHSYYVVPGWQTMDEDEAPDQERAPAGVLGGAAGSVGGEA